MRFLPSLAAVLALSALVGCTGVRFIVDAVPATNELTETTVLSDGKGWGVSKIALIEVSGLIADIKRPGLLVDGENPVGRFVESLEVAAEDDKVRAVVVRINSPGGTVTASDVMYDELMHFKASTGKPVVVQMGEVAASGGYYLACAGDEIFARPTTITGSIGVIMQTVSFAEGLQRIGIRPEAITSGPNKDVGSPWRAMSPEHRALLQDIVDEFYAGFRTLVVERRPGLEPAVVDEVTDGRVVTGRRAAELGLVDEVGGLREAFAAAKRRAGLQRARLVKYHRPLESVGSAYATAPAPAPTANLLRVDVALPFDAPADFLYLWDPSVW